jgi:hypothetical protein
LWYGRAVRNFDADSCPRQCTLLVFSNRAVTQDVSHGIPTEAARVWSIVRQCGIWGRELVLVQFSPISWFLLSILILLTSPRSSVNIPGWCNMPTKWPAYQLSPVLPPPNEFKKKLVGPTVLSEIGVIFFSVWPSLATLVNCVIYSVLISFTLIENFYICGVHFLRKESLSYCLVGTQYKRSLDVSSSCFTVLSYIYEMVVPQMLSFKFCICSPPPNVWYRLYIITCRSNAPWRDFLFEKP